MRTNYPFFTHTAVVEEDYKNTAGDKMSTDIIAILIYTLYIYNVKRTSADEATIAGRVRSVVNFM